MRSRLANLFRSIARRLDPAGDPRPVENHYHAHFGDAASVEFQRKVGDATRSWYQHELLLAATVDQLRRRR